MPPGIRRVLVIAMLLLGVASVSAIVPAASAAPPPRTGFEQRNGASWTTREEEVAFLAAIDEASERVRVFAAGSSELGRTMHLVRIGHPAPRTREAAVRQPVLLLVCTQHGNEPAGREACLQMIRTLGTTTDPATAKLLTRWTVIVVPSANPDGRAANTRENVKGVDINRDHLNLASREAQTIGRVIRDWRPDVLIDLHEFGPGIPVLYDDDLLYLWPRNLNVDPQVHAMSKTLAIDYIGAGAERAGYTADEYGLYAVGDQDVAQTAGDGDEGILRNTAGLRHTIGILIETKVDMRLSPDEALDSSAVNRRRVATHTRALRETVRFMREQEDLIVEATAGARVRKALEGQRRSAPVYFGGADNDPPDDAMVVDPPPCGYRLTGAQAAKLRPVLTLHAIETRRTFGGVTVSMGQGAEPLIPLLLDGRAARSSVSAQPMMRC
jgi:hypothetical protein